MSDQILWYATRGAGAVSLVLLTGVVVLGIAGALRWQTAGWPRFLTTSFHRNLSLLSLVFLSIHIVTAVVDPFTALGWTAAVIPFLSPYRRLWLGLGVVATDLLLAIAVTSLLRRLIGHKVWRLIHWLAYACWPIAVVHGIGTGSDTTFLWMLAIDAACVLSVLAAVAWRLTVRPAAGPAIRPAPEPTW